MYEEYGAGLEYCCGNDDQCCMHNAKHSSTQLDMISLYHLENVTDSSMYLRKWHHYSWRENCPKLDCVNCNSPNSTEGGFIIK